MKFAILVILIVSFITLSWGWTENHNGRPGCKTALEMTRKYWRNHYDSTIYFICEKLGQPGTWAICAGEHMFQPSQYKCVSSKEWYNEPNYDPPSLG